mgnify:CR=1 FL=1
MNKLEARNIYDNWTDQELTDYVSARLPQHLWRIEKRPRCALIRDAILEDLVNYNANPNGQRAMNLEPEF